ncbi:asparagine synthase (glutamine-hydrolyzing) [Coxiella burnetii]|uniref:asparagine synthase (glutamine-hydrolyzing) n=1 Tax=Coxiella burnetii (strain RSA 493 / Nine Mile phase I) TaxID=227377 RepID=Q83D98_COXBU|nr:asparagine synthase (glutamine-hydrolyzing) [Coxiella burnetii]NP_819860.1 asparagine synthetase family protein [Coxiella burnetii RSA 493]AAO90374.1 asparagine synthetase family protein [Coxiella burnetii RSA 493]ARI65673.1 asparagine synthetase B [Coxiella burnetii]ARK27149.1 asparagine synthase (glutamine-hydrolyzing) [Coxiella burnetii]MCF2092941.1 asparagine synthase (glutamine-hydrolyzing) [Coxiella burnetii]MCF2094865.1 asparagine synthase (glutamine-hydrolyzing) [Coxiella burnetii]
MCGIVGFWDFRRSWKKEQYQKVAAKMADQITSRGPDSSGVWCDEKTGLAFGHRRLAVIDLSTAGHQPMLSHSGNTAIIYNGEIYNAPFIRRELENAGIYCCGHSDTEVLLEACELWGVKSAVKKMNGMFAFAYWNKLEKKLYLGRDRLGIKPLFWSLKNNIFYFSSQLKALAAHPVWNVEIDRTALTSYFRFNYIPAPLSIYKGVYKLKPGTILTIDPNQKIIEETFWSLETVCQKNINKKKIDDNEVLEKTETLLRDAVKCRMYSDVPLGAFLSGGIDSSAVVALMQAQSTNRIKTFSIGFYEKEYNEASYAKEVAQHLKTDHHELYLHVDEAARLIPQIPEWYDEPFADSSQIPTYLVSQLARQHVTVSLSGDGGDELFAGYNRYLLAENLWSKLVRFPLWMRQSGSKTINFFSPSAWDKFANVIPRKLRPSSVGDKAHKLAALLTQSSEDLYKGLVSLWERPAELVIDGSDISLWPEPLPDLNFTERMQYIDTLTYLPDDILTKVDRASMAVSLEARIPLLDYRLVEYIWSLPMRFKLERGETKWLLRRVLGKYVPEKLFTRPKMGFGVPIDHWLRCQLREWAEDLLSVPKLEKDGLLHSSLIRQRWQEHLSGKRNWQYSLWSVLMFQLWRERW